MESALTQLLAPSGLSFELVNDRAIAVGKPAKAPARSKRRSDAARAGWRHIALWSSNDAAPVRDSEPRRVLQDADRSGPEIQNVGKTVEVEEIIVTGTHIRGVAPVGSPLIVIDREQIRQSGHGRLQDLLETLPQNFSGSASEDVNTDGRTRNLSRGQAIDLRGLGASATLVLVNGRRQPSGGLEGVFVDISSIASSAVERIEVLTDGASAIYGSDAVGGVVNFILRKDYEGMETSVRYADLAGSAKELRVSQLAGTSWSSGNVLLGYQYNDRDPLMAADTHYGAMNRDYRHLGGGDYRTAAGSPGTILAQGTSLPAYAIPSGQDGRNLSFDDLIPGQGNYLDYVSGIAVLPQQRMHSAFMSATQRIGDRVEVYVDGRYGERDLRYPFSTPYAILLVPPTNPFYVNPFGSGPVRVAYSFAKELGGLQIQETTTKTYSFGTGVNFRLGNEWELKVDASLGQEKNNWRMLNSLNSAFAALADTNPATSLNIFGDGTGNNPETIERLRRTDLGEGVSRVSAVNFTLSGALLALPSGQVRMAIGADHRRERLDATSGHLNLSTGAITSDFLYVGQMQRRIDAVFGELIIPVLGGESGGASPRAQISVAGRYEEYSDFGSTFNPKIGASIELADGVIMRGSWGSSFRAPRLNDLSTTALSSVAVAWPSIPDQQSASGRSDVIYLSGPNPNLHEETADTWTVGLDADLSALASLAALDGLSVSTTYFDMDYRGKIQFGGDSMNTLLLEDQWAAVIQRNPTTDEVNEICAQPNFIGSCPANVAAIIDGRIRNLGSLRLRGLDVSLSGRKALGFGVITGGLSVARMFEYGRAATSSAPRVNVVGTMGNTLDLRLRASLGIDWGGWYARTAVNHANHYDDPAHDTRIGSWTTVDVGAGYRWTKGWFGGTTVQLSAVNLFDREPPFADGMNGFDGANANQQGRSLSMEVSTSW